MWRSSIGSGKDTGTDLSRRLDEGAAHYARGCLKEAERAYLAAAEASPGDLRAPYSLAMIDLRLGRLASAQERLQAVVAREPTHFLAQHNLAATCERLERWAEAADAYARALALKPESAETRLAFARAAATLGRIGEAVIALRMAARDPAVTATALERLGILAPAEVTDDEAAAIRRLAAGGASIGLHFALGGVLEARGDHAGAFAAFAAGNSAKRSSLGVKVAEAARRHARSIADIMARHSRAPPGAQAHPSDYAPIFIIGFPRSGSSLLEQIIASHPEVQGMGETGQMTPVVIAGGDTGAYLDAVRGRGWDGTRRFVDKTLQNFLNIGAIHDRFPRAVIIESARESVDTAFACWRQLFASDHETLYDFADIAAELRRYEEMMAHWRAILPARVRQVRLEDVVADPEGQIRRLITEVCGLPWHPACLRFHETARPVRTASVAQVRRPITNASLGRWRLYGDHAATLVAAMRSGEK